MTSEYSDRDLIAKAITCDLFGPGALTEPAEVSVPAKYRLEECLGRGGFGGVYKAHEPELDRRVALKFLSDASPADVERFRREARFAARLNDPAIVKIYELGEVSGQAYIAMQYETPWPAWRPATTSWPETRTWKTSGACAATPSPW